VETVFFILQDLYGPITSEDDGPHTYTAKAKDLLMSSDECKESKMKHIHYSGKILRAQA
jgi:hypothetical protein